MSDRYTCKRGAVEVELADADGNESHWFIKADAIKVVDDKLFWNVITWHNATRRILTHRIRDKNPTKLYKIISRTDVIEQLGSLKRDELRRIASGGKKSQAKRWRPLKSWTKNVLMMPEYVSITTPDIEGVTGIEVNVLSKNKSLWVELTHESLMYITKAMAAQIDAGGVDKGQRRGMKREREGHPQIDDEDGADEGGVDGVDGVQESVSGDDAVPVADAEPVGDHNVQSPSTSSTPTRQSRLDLFFKRGA